jgi:hypothetical protein
MALTSISTETSSAVQADKQISITHYNGSTAANQTYYTVPAGRKFVGLYWVNDVSYSMGKFPSWVASGESNTQMQHGSTSHFSYPMKITAFAGDFISGGSNYAYHSLFGIESDV